MNGQNTTRILSPRDFPYDVSRLMKLNSNPKMALKLMRVCKFFQLPFLTELNVIKECLLPRIQLLPEKLNQTVKSKKPVIGLCDNFSVICVYSDEQEGYNFIDGDEWNGAHGNDLFISFHQARPQIGHAALNVFNTQPSFVVFDLIKIMVMPAGDVRTSKLWGFKISKDNDYPVLLEFDNFDGTKKLASPAFLMALLLREHRKAIRNEIGEMPAELAFCFPCSAFNSEQKARVQQGLQEACELLKIGYEFIEV